MLSSEYVINLKKISLSLSTLIYIWDELYAWLYYSWSPLAKLWNSWPVLGIRAVGQGQYSRIVKGIKSLKIFFLTYTVVQDKLMHKSNVHEAFQLQKISYLSKMYFSQIMKIPNGGGGLIYLAPLWCYLPNG